MKLSSIDNTHVEQAAEFIDQHGIPPNYIFNNYWVQLPNGKEYPFKYLVRIAYQSVPDQEGVWLDFQSNHSYREHIRELGFKILYYKEGISFISEHEMYLYCSLSSKPYRSENAENRRQGDLLKPFVRKIKYWADHCIIEGFKSDGDNKWQWSGHFKPYLWHRIYRPGDSGYVYFVLGFLGTGHLYMELNCQRSQYASGNKEPLSPELIDRFDKFLMKSDYQEVKIPIAELINRDWDSIIEEGQNFILKYKSLYDKLENEIFEGGIADAILPKNELSLENPPESTMSRVGSKRSYKGRKVDWSKNHSESIKLGDAGERLVIHSEKEKLKALGKEDLAEKVQKKLDGEGYDVLSFDEHGNEIHIEVKTTLGRKSEPFYMSQNELQYAEEYPKNYFLFRLYNFDYIENSASFYILDAQELKGTQKTALSFEIVIGATKTEGLDA